jgi:site-specific DNA recombinase
VPQALSSLERQQERLLTAYLGDVLELPEFERKRRELAQKQETLRAQHQQFSALAKPRIELSIIATSIDAFCQQVRSSLATATFEQKRQLVELLIDHVVVTDEEVEIRYVMPTSEKGVRQPFCHLRLDYRSGLSERLRNRANRSVQSQSVLHVLQ